jgi:hypothetical protein
MRFKLLLLTLSIVLSACQSNSEGTEINLGAVDNTDGADSDGGTVTAPSEPDVEDPVDGPDDNVPSPSVPVPKVCVSSHSNNEAAEPYNSRADFLFYPEFSSDNLQSYEVLTDTASSIEVPGLSSISFPFQSITGNTLATQEAVNNGEWLFETNSKKLIFKDTLLGSARQVSNLDTGGYQICSMVQIKPAIDRMSEFYINYGPSCSLTTKVNLAMTSTVAAVSIPNTAITEGVAIFDADANWLGQLYKVTDQGVVKLALQKPDFCSQNVVFEFTAEKNSWAAQQYSDGSLLIRLENKVYYLSALDALAMVEDESNYSLPNTALITLASAENDVWLGKNDDEIYYTNLIIDSETPSNNKAELYVYNIASKVTSSAISLYSGADVGKTIIGFDKIKIDDDSVWMETQFATEVAGSTVYNRRYSRWDISNQVLDLIVQLDRPLQSKSQKSEWHSIDNNVYLKMNSKTLITQAIAGEKDYLLMPDNAPSATSKVWHFIKQKSAIDQQADAVIAWDYSNHGSNQYVPELINVGGTTVFPTITRKVIALSMTPQFDDLSLFWDISCTSGCDNSDPIAQLDYRVSAIDHNDNSQLSVVYHETCDVTRATENPDVPQSKTCTVN